MSNLINKNQDEIRQDISNYLVDVTKRAEIKFQKSKNHPKMQHTVPRFILNNIAANDISNVTKEKGLMLKEHYIEFSEDQNKQGDFIEGDKISPKVYSTKLEIYDSKIFSEEKYLEYLFSIIEGDAARFIRSKVSTSYNVNDKSLVNPYFFSTPYLSEKPQKIRIRVILSTFFAIQVLRSYPRKKALEQIISRRVGKKLDFAESIIEDLENSTIANYSRQWTWVRVPKSEMFTSELGAFGVSNCNEGRAGWIMPLARRDYIFLHELTDTHLNFEDKLVVSTSGILYNWYINCILKDISNLQMETSKNSKDRISFVSHQEAKISIFDISKPSGCCMPCLLTPIREDPRNEIFKCDDIHKSAVNKNNLYSTGSILYSKS